MTHGPAYETCQRGCVGIQVDARGRVTDHSLPFWNVGCLRSGHPSREELARRKTKRAAKREALAAELLPDAETVLDAYQEDRPQYVEETKRVAEFRRVALFEFNRRNNTRHRHAFSFMADGLAGDDRLPRCYRCRFCGASLQVPAVAPDLNYSLTDIDRAFAPHLTLCALLYLAGRLPPRATESADV